MKKIILLLFIILITAIQANAFTGAIQAVLSAGGSVINAYPCIDATHDSANNAILACEDFSGTSACYSGDTTYANCRATTGIIFGTPNYKATGFEGQYSLYLDLTAATPPLTYKEFIAADSAYSYSHVRFDALSTGTKAWFGYYSTATARAYVQMLSGGYIKLYHGTANVTSSGTLSAGKVYAFWSGYVSASASPGSDGYLYLAWVEVSGGTPPAKPTVCTPVATTCEDSGSMAIATGTTDSSINRVAWGTINSADTTFKLTVDHIRVHSSDFGSSVQ